MKVYLNWKGLRGRETVDEFGPELGQSMREFRAYVHKMVANYRECGTAVYKSSRPCANWRR